MRLLIVTQTVDERHPVLGFFVAWISAFTHCPGIDSVDIVCFGDVAAIIPGCTMHPVVESSKFRRVIAYRRLLRRLQPDAVFVHMTPLWLVMGADIWKSQRAKISLWYTHGSDSWLLRLAVALSDITFTATRKAFPFDSDKVAAVGHAIHPSFASVERISSLNGILRFVAVGRLMPRKRILETVELFQRIHRIEPASTLDLVGPELGSGEYVERIQKKIHEAGLDSVIRLITDRSIADMPEVYASHDALLHLSATGSLDKVVLEALASGCAVYSTNPATREALGEAWWDDERPDDDAARSAIEHARNGVSMETRQLIAEEYSLPKLIHALMSRLTQISR